MSPSRSSHIPEYFKALCTYGLGSLLQSALTFLLLPLYLSSFTPAEFGVLSLLLSVQTIAILILGVGANSVISRLYYERTEEDRKKLAGTCLLLIAGLGALGAFFIFLGAAPIASIVFKDAEHTDLFALLSLSVLFTLIRDYPGMLCRIERRAFQYVLLALLSVGLDFTFKILFINSWQRGVAGYFESSVIGGLFFFALAYPTIAKFISLRFCINSVKQLLRLGSPYILSGMSMWVLDYSNRLFLERYVDSEAVGIYSLGFIFAAVFTVTVARPVALILDPFIFSHLAKKSEGLGKTLAFVLTGSLLLGGAAFLFISLCSEELLRLLSHFIDMDPVYFEALHLVPLLTATPLLYFLCNPPGIALLWAQRTVTLSFATAFCAAVNIVLNVLLIPKFGLYGAAYSSIASYGIFAFALYVIAGRYVEMEYRWRQNATLIILLLLSLGAGLSVSTTPMFSLLIDLLIICVLFLGGSALYLARSGSREWVFFKGLVWGEQG